MVKKCEAGKQQAKKARLELEEVTADPNVEEIVIEENNQQTILLKPKIKTPKYS